MVVVHDVACSVVAGGDKDVANKLVVKVCDSL